MVLLNNEKICFSAGFGRSSPIWVRPDSGGRPKSEFGRIRTAVPNLSSAGFGRTGGFGRIRADGRVRPDSGGRALKDCSSDRYRIQKSAPSKDIALSFGFVVYSWLCIFEIYKSNSVSQLSTSGYFGWISIIVVLIYCMRTRHSSEKCSDFEQTVT